MNKYKVEEKELIEILKKIHKTDNKNIINMIMCVIGVIIMLFSIVYFLMNTDLFWGCFSIFFVGSLVLCIYLICYFKAKKKIEILNKEYKMLKDIYDLKEGEYDDVN